MADGDRLLQNLQSELQSVRSSNKMASTLACYGHDELVQKFLEDNVKIQSTGPTANRTQLYVASFWGLKDSVKQLLEAGTDANIQNEETLWTPLHAATFQEHGPVIMLLLEHGAQPELRDSDQRTPADFASASDKIWPFFAALDIPRTSRAALVEKRILRSGSGTLQPKEAGSGIQMADYNPIPHKDSHGNNYLAAMSGDVLADEQEHREPNDPRSGTHPYFSVWK